MTPEPMNRMVDRQSKVEAIAKKKTQRQRMVVQNVPPTELCKINNIIITDFTEQISAHKSK